MPFTPIHMGPGLLFKSVGGARFSLVGFGLAQVLIDIEPLVRILRGDRELHGWTHTLPGALLVGTLALPLARWLYPVLATFANRELAGIRRSDPALPPHAGWVALAVGCFVGTLSHIGFDAVMHADLRPLRQWQEHNPLLQLLSLDALHGLCFAAGALGLALLGARYAFSRANRR